MSAPVVPEQTQQTQSAEPQGSSTNNDSIIQLQDQVIQEKERQIRELTSQIASNNRPVEPPPAPKKAEEFFESPHATVDEIVTRRINESMRPLLEVTNQTRREKEYQRLKNFAKEHPKAKPFFVEIEPTLDQLALQTIGQGIDITEGMIQSTILNLIGTLAVQNPQRFAELAGTSQTPQPNRMSNSQIPASIPSNQGPPPSGNDTKDPDDLARTKMSELELRLARERGMTPSRFIELRDGGFNNNERGTGSFEVRDSDRKKR